MAYFLGIDVGAARTVAAVARPGEGDVETVDFGERGEAGEPLEGIASVLHLGADGVLAVGAAAQERMPREPDRVVAGFPGQIGDDAMLLAGEPWAPEELTAWLVRWVVDRVTEREGEPAAAVAVSHAASRDADRTRLLADAVAEQELDAAFVASSEDGGPEASDRTDGPSDPGDDGAAPAAQRAARALRAAAAVPSSKRPGDGAGSRQLVVGGAIAALASGIAGAPDGHDDADDDDGT